MHRLSDAFPGVRFEYEAAEPSGVAAARAQMTLPLRIWLFVFGKDTAYPRRHGFLESDKGWAVEFYFEARQPVRSIMVTSYGRTAGLEDNFNRLTTATGWKAVYPRF